MPRLSPQRFAVATIVLAANLFAWVGARAQAPHPSADLTATIRSLDAKLFTAYNTCDLDTLGKLVSDDLEFYHDVTGLAVGKKPFLDAIRQNICGKVNRVLVESSLEVYPLNHYGAVELGVHRFTHPGHPGENEGAARFVMLWQQKDGDWKLTRVISYEHGMSN